jgi:DNA ligase-1
MTSTEVTFKPMLARSETLSFAEVESLPYPLLVSPKLDGMRIVKIRGKVLTRNLKPLANLHVRAALESILPNGIDGELCLPDWTARLEDVMSAFRSVKGEPAFSFAAFDYFEGCTSDPFHKRMSRLAHAASGLPHVELLRHERVNSPEQLRARFDEWVAEGFEGLMVRRPDGPYKMGRSTLKEGYLLKLKPWHDEEATIIDCIEEFENTNQDRTATGARSSAQAGKVGKNVLGAFACEFDDGTEFTVSGFTEAQKREWWGADRGQSLIGSRVTVKYQVVHGGRAEGQAPRHPKFKCFREDV